MSDNESDAVLVKKEKRKVSDKQMAALRKGMDALKAKRETLAKDREVHEEKQTKGEIPADVPKPKFIPNPKAPKVVKVSATESAPEVVQVVRKKRETKANPMIAEMAALRAEVSALKAPAKEVVIEKIVDRPVERVVEKTKVLSGSDLLNQIFFNK
jgi:hypothetical protein